MGVVAVGSEDDLERYCSAAAATSDLLPNVPMAPFPYRSYSKMAESSQQLPCVSLLLKR